MRTLPLYPAPPRAPVEVEDPLDFDRSCKRCDWAPASGPSCLPADGEPGGLLVVGDAPVKGATRPFMSKSGEVVRLGVARHWDGPVAWDTAARCSPPTMRVDRKTAFPRVSKCRPYTAAIVRDVRPTRILAVGPWAAYSILGRSIPLESTRRGFTFLSDGTPVFLLDAPLSVLDNKFRRVRWETDLRWALTALAPKPDHWSYVVHLVDDAADARAAAAFLRGFSDLAVDCETAGEPHNFDFTVLCVGVAPVDEMEGDRAYVWSGRALADHDARAELASLMADPAIRKTGSNIKYDAVALKAGSTLVAELWREGLDIDVRPIAFDTQYVKKILEPDTLGRLEVVAELVGMGGHKEEADDALHDAIAAARRKVLRPGEKPHDHWCVHAIRPVKYGGLQREAMKYAYGLLDDDLLHRYQGRDAVASALGTAHLRRLLWERTKAHNLWRKIFEAAIPTFVRMELKGIPADREAFEHFSAYLNTQMDVLRREFKAYDRPDAPFNPDSQPQISDLLFNRLKLKPIKFSRKTQKASTAADVLEYYKGSHPVIDQILEWRRLSKLDGTYARGMLERIRDDGRIHPTFKLDGTETGRISSEGPNGQNLPRPHTPEGKMARDGFTSSPGRILLEVDFSQLELRIAAALAGDEEMVGIFQRGEDLHWATARLIAKVAWNIDPSQVTEAHRSYAKTINFGLLYGKTDAGLAAELGISVTEAAAIRKAILGRFKKLAKLIKDLLYFARRNGYVEIPWDDETAHVRPLYDIAGPDDFKRSNAENSSINTPVQGRASFFCLVAIPLIQAYLDDNCIPADIILTVHDSILIDVEEEYFDEVAREVKRIMEDQDNRGVPLVVDAKAGYRWGTLRTVKVGKGEVLADAKVRWAKEALEKEAA